MATNSMLTPAGTKPKAKAMPKKKAERDPAVERNFTKKGTPRLSASSGTGAGSMGQRR